jgi:Predicted membrane protein
MPDLIAVAFAEETVAAQAAEELERRADDLPLDPDAIGVIVCERDGSCQLTTSRQPGATAAWSKFWGFLFGVLMGEIESNAIGSEFRDQVKGLLKPGTSMLFIAAERARPDAATEALSQYGGTVLKYPLAKERMAELWDALDGEHARA